MSVKYNTSFYKVPTAIRKVFNDIEGLQNVELSVLTEETACFDLDHPGDQWILDLVFDTDEIYSLRIAENQNKRNSFTATWSDENFNEDSVVVRAKDWISAVLSKKVLKVWLIL